VEYLKGDVENALSALELAIDKSDTNVPAHYMLRGLCFARQNDFETAINNFSIVL
jgi:hypothetical protein